ncbi:hypothetical protein L9F63_014612 [Diploptera punctata]|uniref:L-seryl-tRNA(Sec) kinase n=1 Tax=Diploptera punctata TaxID=6984 RepID=A0AAD8A8E5_DIPPU|nr:hypothetical protein L9F63_014612 [Diploptera punctata]
MAESEICIVVLVGLPASGKTTLCKSLKEHFEKQSEGNYVFTVCYDEMIPVDVAKWQQDDLCWSNSRRNVLKQVAELIHCLKCSVANVHLSVKYKIETVINFSGRARVYIFIDDNMYYRSMRYQYYQLAKLYNVSFCQIYVRCDVNVALTRNSSRDVAAVVPDEIILKMAEKLEAPNVNSRWEKLSVTVCEESDVGDVCKFVEDAAACRVCALEDGAEMRAESRAVCASSVLHQVDVASRKLVGERIRQSGLTTALLQTRAKLLADVRRYVMDAIKSGRIELPQDVEVKIRSCHPDSGTALHDFLDQFFALHQL